MAEGQRTKLLKYYDKTKKCRRLDCGKKYGVMNINIHDDGVCPLCKRKNCMGNNIFGKHVERGRQV